MVLTERNFLISDINFERQLIHGNYIGTNAKDIYCSMVSIDDKQHPERTKSK
jgi:hypothetical protein